MTFALDHLELVNMKYGVANDQIIRLNSPTKSKKSAKIMKFIMNIIHDFVENVWKRPFKAVMCIHSCMNILRNNFFSTKACAITQ